MSMEKQFDKLEARVEKLDDKVDVIRDSLTELRAEVKIYTQEVVKHVGGDDKVIIEIMPALQAFQLFCREDLPQIKEVLLERKVKQLNESNGAKFRTYVQQNITIIGGILTAISISIGIYFKFVG